MTAADVAKMIEASVAKSLANAMALVNVAPAPVAVPVPVPASVGKRTLSPEQKAKMAEGRRKAAAAKTPAKTAPAATPVPVAAPVAGRVAETFTGHGATIECFAAHNKAGKPYAGIKVADTYGASIVLNEAQYDALSRVIRSKADEDMRAFFALHGRNG